MKSQFPYLIFLIILFSTSFLFCTKSDSCGDVTEEIVDENLKALINYENGDVIQYMTEDSSNMTLSTQRRIKKDTFFIENCMKISEKLFIDLIDSDLKTIISIQAQTILNTDQQTFFLRVINSYNINSYQVFLVKSDLSGEFDCEDITSNVCHSSLTVNGIEYQDVIELRWSNGQRNIYFSWEEGIIKFTDPNSVEYFKQ